MYRVCISPSIYSDSWATMDTASETGVRGTSFRAIKIIIIICMKDVFTYLVGSKALTKSVKVETYIN